MEIQRQEIMILSYITPEIVEEINRNLDRLFWPAFNKFKEWFYTYQIETAIEDKIKHLLLVVIVGFLFIKAKNFVQDFNDKYNFFR